MTGLIETHKQAVYSQMLRVCGNKEDADDALADAILAALQCSHALRDRANFRAWLTTVASRCCTRVQVRRRLGADMSLDCLGDLATQVAGRLSEDPLDAVLEQETKECLLRALDVLPARDRAIFEWSDIDGLSSADIARQTGLTQSAVKARLHRARKAVRIALDAMIAAAG